MTRKVQHKQRKRANKGRYYNSAKNTYSVPISNIDFIKRWQWNWESMYNQRIIIEED